MIAPRTSPRLLARPLLRRESVDQLKPAQLSQLRRAVRAVLQIRDDRGYYYHAGIHGLPLREGQSKMWCEHHTGLFLPWHRAYLYLFERALRDQVPDVMLPWWDWSSPFSHTHGIPEAYTKEQIDGENNPLYSVRIPDAAEPELIPGEMPVPEGWNNETFRRPSPLSQLPSADELREIRTTAADFMDFSQRLEDIHDGMHGWVGGTMTYIEWAAYDPIFWAHHTMIDREWRIWQRDHSDPIFSDSDFLGQVLPPFELKVADVLDVRALGYEYASSSAEVPGGRGG